MTTDARIFDHQERARLRRQHGHRQAAVAQESLYSRLVWVTFDPRGYVETPTYYGPDRRFKIEGFPDGQGTWGATCRCDLAVEVASDGSDLSQNEIDSLFAGARNV